MKITKYVHSFLLVEDEGKTAIFDPGVMSREAFDINKLDKLDYIFITHNHADHMDIEIIKALVNKFPEVKIVTTKEAVGDLAKENIKAQSDPIPEVKFFSAPHESVAPLFSQPEEIGIHYLNKLTNPGDSHSFNETKEVLAMPITAPWGSSIKALNVILGLEPKYVIPIHDWHWSDVARKQSYDRYADVLRERGGITFYKPETGIAIEIPS